MSEHDVREELIEISQVIRFASYHPGCAFHQEGTSIAVELGALSFDQLTAPKALRFWTLLGMLPESIKVRVWITIPDRSEIDPRFENVLTLLDPINNLVSLTIDFVEGDKVISIDTSSLSNHKNLTLLSSAAHLNFQPLKDLPLTRLEANVSAQEDLSPIGCMTMLETLLVPETNSTDCSFLENLTELKQLSVLAKPFYLSQLKNLAKLESLRAYSVEFDLDSLRLEKLKTLFISDSNFDGSNLAKYFPAVEGVFLYNSVVEPAFNICELTSLKSMQVKNSSLSMSWTH